jgi:hypothetical protein
VVGVTTSATDFIGNLLAAFFRAMPDNNRVSITYQTRGRVGRRVGGKAEIFGEAVLQEQQRRHDTQDALIHGDQDCSLASFTSMFSLPLFGFSVSPLCRRRHR